MLKSYKVICQQCKAEREIRIFDSANQQTIDWLEDRPGALQSKIVSGRKRLDGNWGFQCLCGNNDILTKQEDKMITNPASPQPEELSTIVNNLKVQAPKFALVEV